MSAATTPTFSQHARCRCLEMGISTKIAKRIVQHATLRRPDKPGSSRTVATSSSYPGYAVVYESQPGGMAHVVTVLFDTKTFTARCGMTFAA